MVAGKLMGWLNPQHLVALASRVRPNSEFIVTRDQRLTRRQTFTRVEALAAGLQALGVQKGDRVVTLLPACPEAVYTLFLPWVLGTVNVPLNPLLGEHELRHILVDCGAKVVVTTQRWYGQDYPAILTRLLPGLPDLRHVIVRDARDGGTLAGGGPVFLPLQDVMACSQPLRRARISGDDVMTIAYTSGTTGLPKGVVHTRRRAFGLAVRGAQLRMNLRALRCLLLPYAPYYTAGRTGIFVSLLAGGKLILMDRLDPQQMLEHIQNEKVTQIGGSPTMYRLLLSASGQERYDLSSVQRLAFSSEPLQADLAQALYERLGCSLENMYGTTETMMISWTDVNDSWERVAATVGKPAPGVRVQIVDDDRQPLPLGTHGEVATQTAQMMIGYYNAPQSTTQVLDEAGWFYTGDIGYMDENGYLRLVDRKNDLIIRGGQNVYPAEVERYLERHPSVRRAGVIGVPSQVSGETVWAYVELYPGASLGAKEILNFCRGQIAPFKIPAQVRFIERLPTTATNKVQRYKLREMATEELSDSKARRHERMNKSEHVENTGATP